MGIISQIDNSGTSTVRAKSIFGEEMNRNTTMILMMMETEKSELVIGKS